MKLFNKISKMKIRIFVFTTMMIFISCDSFLEQEQAPSNITADFVYTTAEGLETGVVALYNFNRALYENGEWEWHKTLVFDGRSDIALNRAGVLSLFGRYIWGIKSDDFSSSRVSQYWSHYYKIIDRANAIIVAAEAIQGIDEVQKNKIIAESKWMRANSYFTLYRMFNNIYVTTEPTTPENAFDVVDDKSSEAEIFTLLNSDLDFAIANLEWTTPDFGRVTKGAAKHLKAKVAMWEGNWNEAKLQAESTINDGPHSLVPSTGDVFTGNLNHSETLYAFQFAQDVPGGSRNNMVNFNFIPRYERVPGGKLTMDYGGKGGGFLLPNSYLLNLLAEDPNDDRDNDTYFRLQYFYNDADDLPDGVSLGDVMDIYEPTTDPNNPSPTNNQYYERISPSCLKFVQDEGADPESQLQIRNFMLYRLGETYLIAAEANMRLGNDGDALTYLNTLRARANAGPLGAIDQQVIMDEHARELSFEGQRSYFLKRLGVLYEQVIAHSGDDNYKNEARVNMLPHHVTWAIPQAQLSLLGPNYPQNDGY